MHDYEIKRETIVVVRRGRFVRKDNWTASWIWCEGESRPRNTYLYARKTFKLPAKPAHAGLRITADSRYKLFVNGTYVGRGPVRSLPGRQYFDTYDIAEYLTKGNNVIAVLAYHLGQGTYSYMPGRAALICEAEIEWDGGSEKIITDETWKVMKSEAWNNESARMSPRLGFQEVFDANLDPDGWMEVKFRDAKWPQATVLGKSPMRPFERLMERLIPHLKETDTRPTAIVGMYDCPLTPEDATASDMPAFMISEALAPLQSGQVEKSERLIDDKNDATTIKVPETSGVSILLDFGREVFGSVELEFSRSHGGIVDIGYSESLEDGWINPNRDDIKYSDRLILRKGKQVWCSFEPRGFRYMQIEFRKCPKPIAINKIAVFDTSYPVELKGSFESSDELLNQVWKVGAETARLCMQDTYIDSPWRERAQWWDNAYIASKTAYYAFGDTALLGQGLRYIALSQERNGIVLALYPSVNRENFPDFGALWVMSVWDYYARTGDKRMLSDLYPCVFYWIQWISRYANADGLLNKVDGDLFIDWGAVDRRGEVAALNCIYIGALNAASRMAQTMKKTDDADRYLQMAAKVRNSLSKHFWTARGLYADARVDGVLQEHYSRQTNTLAVLADVPDHYQKAAILRQLSEENGGLSPITTPYFTTFVVEALAGNGYMIQALDVIRRKWGAMVSNGASTFGEFFTSEGTKCQGSAAAPTYLLQAYVLGVTQESANRVRVEPQLGDLQWAKGIVPTEGGPVVVDWQFGRHGFTMTLVVPHGMSAVLVPPRGTGNNRVLVNNKDVGAVEVEVGPGVHNIRVIAQSPSRMRRRTNGSEAERAPEPLPIPANRPDLEYVVQMIQILSELEAETVARAALAPVQPEEGTEEASERRGRRSRRRPRYRRSDQPGEETTGQTQEGTEGAEEATVVAEGTDAAAGTAVEPTESHRRSRRSRGRRSSRRPAESGTEVVETTATTEVVEAVVEEQVAASDTESTPAPAKRTRRRTRRGGRSSRGEGSAVVEETPSVAEESAPTVQEMQPVTADTEAPIEAAPSHAKRRRRRPAKKESIPAAAEALIEPVSSPVAEAPASEAVEPPKRPRRTRKPSAPARQSEPVESTAKSVPMSAPSEAPKEAHVESGAEAEAAPKRRTTRRRPAAKKSAESTAKESDTAVTIVESKPVVAAEAVKDAGEPSNGNGNGKKPVRRTRRPRKVTSDEAAPVEE